MSVAQVYQLCLWLRELFTRQLHLRQAKQSLQVLQLLRVVLPLEFLRTKTQKTNESLDMPLL